MENKFPVKITNIYFSKAQKEEKRIAKLSDKLIFINKKSNKFFLIKDSINILPKFYYTPINRNIFNKKLNLSFVGDYKWYLNTISAEWIVKKLACKLVDEIHIYFYGLNFPEYLKDYIKKHKLKNLHIMGFVKNISDIYKDKHYSLCPVIQKSGGLNLKVCESIFNKVPVLGNKIAFDGLDKKIFKNCKIIELNNNDWANYLNKMVKKK